MPNDFETCTTGTRNLVAEQGARIEAQNELLDEIDKRLESLATRDDLDAKLYAAELREWIADRRADR